MSERGMKKWAPYRSLPEHTVVLNNQMNKKIVEKPQISSEEAEEINEILVNYHGEPLRVEYYRNSKIFKEEIVIKRIDAYEKKLVLPDRRSIKLIEIIKLERID